MFSYISGILAEKTQSYAVVDVNGVGFKIYSSLTSLSDSKINCGENVTFHYNRHEDNTFCIKNCFCFGFYLSAYSAYP